MAKQLFLEGIDDLEGLSGVPLACKKVGRGQYKCTTIGKGMRSVAKGTVVTKLVTEGRAAAGRRLGKKGQETTQKTAFSAAATTCGGKGKGVDAFRACMSQKLSQPGSRSSGRRDWIGAGKKSAAESSAFYGASRSSMGKLSRLALAAKACKGKKGDAFKECVKSKAKKG